MRLVGGPWILLALLPGICCYGQGLITAIAGTDRVLPWSPAPVRSTELGEVFAAVSDKSGNVYLALAQLCQVARVSPDGMLTVVAGNGRAGYSGDGGPAIQASINAPQALAFDADGNLLIADTHGNRVRKVTPDGIITTLAGTGEGGYSGEGGPASAAALSLPDGVAADSAGNVYIADYGNNVVRRVDPQGIITTFAGTGKAGYSGDGKSAILAQLNQPYDVSTDAKGNLYIADNGNNVVRRVDTSGTITTVAGNGSFGNAVEGVKATATPLASPQGVVADAAGNIYIADSNTSVIRRVDASGTIRTYAGGGGSRFYSAPGPALQALLKSPVHVSIAPDGSLLIADKGQFMVFQVTPGGALTAVAGYSPNFNPLDGGPATSGLLTRPYGAAIDAAGNIFIADSGNHRIRKVAMTDAGSAITTVAGNGVPGASGDGIQATNASIDTPEFIAVDRSGNLYISDTFTHRIRKVTPAGVISTVAGNGQLGSGGDGQQASSAQLAFPQGLAFDAAGNLYIADTQNQKIRRVTPNGVISTFAGNGKSGFAGDNGPATGASLNQPWDVTVDLAGNVYIADVNNLRIRRVDLNGVITTFAGDPNGSFADGIPALKALFAFPSGVTTDSAGNVYIADRFAHHIRKVSLATGTIATVAGSNGPGYNGDGGQAVRALLNDPIKAVVDAAGDIFIVDSANNRLREVLASRPAFTAMPASVSLVGTSAGPLTAVVPVNLASAVPGLAFTASRSTTDGSAWLQAQSSGTIPFTLQIGADPSQLAPGVYYGTVTVTAPDATPSVQTIAVDLTVSAPDSGTPMLALDNTTFSFNLLQGAAAASQTLNVLNQGPGSLDFTVSATTVTGSWLKATASAGTSTGAQPAAVTLIVDPQGLDAGSYTGSVVVTSTSSGQTAMLAINLTVSAASQQLVLSQSGLSFIAVERGGAPLPQTFAVLNSGQNTLNYSIQFATLSGGNWLTVSPGTGVADGQASSAPTVTVSVSAAGLSAGEYFAEIKVLAPGAINSPQSVTVDLTVLTAGSFTPPEVRPTGLVFVGSQLASPGSQEVAISNPGSAPLPYLSSRQTNDGGNWLNHLPVSGTVLPDQPGRVVVQPDFTNLSPGIARGVISFQFGDGTVRPVSVLAVVGAGSSVTLSKTGERFASACVPKSISIQPTNLQSVFRAILNQPITVSVKIADDCQAPVTASRAPSLGVSFSNHDPAIKLVETGDGVWTGTWSPHAPSSGPVTIQITVFVPVPGVVLPVANQIVLTANLAAASTAPRVGPNAIVNDASLVDNAPLAPGSLVTISGTLLFAGPSQSFDSQPLPTDVGGTQVRFGDQPLSLFFASDGQLKAQLPFNLPVNTQLQLLVRREDTLSQPQDFSVAAAQPAIFTENQQGFGQGSIFNSTTNLLVDSQNPAHAGDAITIFCTGLGAVSPPVTPGTLTPLTPFSTTILPVTATIDGVPASVTLAALAPGTIGRYQVSVVVPPGISSGDSVPVVIKIAGQSSPPATLAAR
jgi:uncharacterized protein (TIGR03437 family)